MSVSVMLMALTVMQSLANEGGQPQLETLLSRHAAAVQELRENKTRLDDASHADVRAQIDAAAHQRDAFASGLFWHTDLAAAQAEAKRTKRPILSLRLLGRLDEEYSCANSRFFRTVLYANAEVSKLLREQFVLHWKSVRPAPLLTIDMGDGRRIKRTITGNSIHYVLNAQGQVIDALPGIYSPAAFQLALERATQQVGRQLAELRAWHGREAHQLCLEWLNAAVRAGAYGDEARNEVIGSTAAEETLRRHAGIAFSGWHPDKNVRLTIPPADCRLRFEVAPGVDEFPLLGDLPGVQQLFKPRKVAAPFQGPAEFDPAKAMVERPAMSKALPGPANVALDPASPVMPTTSLAGRMTPALWATIAAPFQSSVRLDESSRRLMMQKLPVEIMLSEELKTGASTNDGTGFGRLLRRFEESIGRDMVRNEFYYHPQIHQWLEEDKDGNLAADVEALNRRVYDELFLTPDYDAWLGLVPEDTYTALEKDGCACDSGAPPMRKTASQ